MAARGDVYSYKANSNLVLTAQRTGKRSRDPSGEVSRMDTKNLGFTMGDRVRKETPADVKAKLEKLRKKRERGKGAGGDDAEYARTARKRSKGGAGGGRAAPARSVGTEVIGEYRPLSGLTRQIYERLLAFVHARVGDVPRTVLVSAVDETLLVLKDPSAVVGPALQRAIEDIVGKLTSEDFNRLVNMAKSVTDFDFELASGRAATGGASDDEDDGKIDETMGVRILFDDEDAEGADDDDDDGLVVRSDDEMSDEEGKVDAVSSGVVRGKDLDGGAAGGAVADEEGMLDVHSIDAFFLQRELSKVFADATQSQQLAEEVLTALRTTDERACENDLVQLLDLSNFELIRMLLKNRARVMYCTRLRQAQSDAARAAIEAEMASDAVGGGAAILDALHAQQSATTWAQDRTSKLQKQSRAEVRQLGDEVGRTTEEEGASSAIAAAIAAAGVGGLAADERALLAFRADRAVNLDTASFNQGSRLMTNRKCKLPKGSWRAQKKGYEEVHVPAYKPPPRAAGEAANVNVAETLPEWTHAAFKGITTLNRVQSQVYKQAFEGVDNMLLCAPTGAGKTNVAMLAVLNVVGQHLRPLTAEESAAADAARAAGKAQVQTHAVDSDFKIVYVAPMKALVAEMVRTMGRRLAHLGIVTKELSGDVQLTRAEIADTHIIVTTPEKWDIITRKAGDRTYTQLVRLLIIDEIHLLHDLRGTVIESIVSRTIRQIETTREMVRILGLSATLPNYEDVATFLRIDPSSGLFFFDNAYRPVPLEQQYIGITEKKPLKRHKLMNEICYEKVKEQVAPEDGGPPEQVLVFVHSRKETAKTARALIEMAMELDEPEVFLRDDAATREILLTESEAATSSDLQEILPHGMGIHHAGLSRDDRSLVEDLFSDGRISVLFSTSTLAWGVNLPAHCVIIKGTQVYSPEEGRWIELSYLDMMQMLGRAGRPQFDTRGEGVILTAHSELQYYLSLMNEQLPIESQLIRRLPDQLNAEVVLGNVQSVAEAVQWLGYSYLYVRMLRNPTLYGVDPNDAESGDKLLTQRRADLIHAAAQKLAKDNLIKYDRRTGAFQSTPLGRIASHYYIAHESIRTYNNYLKPTMSDIELFRLFSLSYEFRNLCVRQEEKLELKRLIERVPIPVKEGVEEPSAKVNVLLQAYISRLSLAGFALVCDMVYVQQSAGRIMRALFEICLRRGWANLARRTLDLCKMVDHRVWLSQTPLRQFKTKRPGRVAAAEELTPTILSKLERRSIPWDRMYDLKPQDLGELVRMPRLGRALYQFVHRFPRIELQAHVQPITRSILRVELTIEADFEYLPEVHDWGVSWHVLVEDSDGDELLHHEIFILRGTQVEDTHSLAFTVNVTEPLPPQYFVRVIADRWLHAESVLPVSFRHLILPTPFSPHTSLLDLRPMPITALRNKAAQRLYGDVRLLGAGFRTGLSVFNAVQTQTFNCLYETDDNTLLCAPSGSGKIYCAEFAMLRLWNRAPNACCVFVAPVPTSCDRQFAEWSRRFGAKGLGKTVVRLTGDDLIDVKLIASAQLVVADPQQWDKVSRRWKQRRAVREVGLFIVSDLHLIGGQYGPTLEVVVSRMRYIAAQLAEIGGEGSKSGRSSHNKLRVVALAASVANADDLANWIGAPGAISDEASAGSTAGLYSFHPNVRPTPLDIHVQGFTCSHFGERMLTMAKPCFNAICVHASRLALTVSRTEGGAAQRSQSDSTIIFVASRRQTMLTAIDLITFAKSAGDEFMFVGKGDAASNAIETAIAALEASAVAGVASASSASVSVIGGAASKAAPGAAALRAKQAVDVLATALRSGVGYWHSGLSAYAKKLVASLYERGAIGVIVATQASCWGIPFTAKLVVLMGGQRYDSRESKYVDCAIADILQMVGCACRPHLDASGKGGVCVILCQNARKQYFKKFLYEPLPVESHLDHRLADHLNAEIVVKTVENKQDAVDYLTWSFYYRRINQNPGYYNLIGTTPQHMSDHLSELIEETLTDLSEARCVEVEEDVDVRPLNLGMIASYYYAQYTSIELFASSINAKTKMKGLITILCAASEFETTEVRPGDEARLLKRLGKYIPHRVDNKQPPTIKSNVLLQSHFSRASLPAQLRTDQRRIVTQTPSLLSAMVDVIASSNYLAPALAAMELQQMVVQGRWNTDSPLLQIPHFTAAMVAECNSAVLQRDDDDDEEEDESEIAHVESVYDILEMGDEQRTHILRSLSAKQQSDVAAFCNAYPSIDVAFEVLDADDIAAGDIVEVQVQLSLEDDEDEENAEVFPRFPTTRKGRFWLIVGDPKTNKLLSIKRVNPPAAGAPLRTKLDIVAPETLGKHSALLYLISDSYLGCDQQYELNMNVLEAVDDDDDDEDEPVESL